MLLIAVVIRPLQQRRRLPERWHVLPRQHAVDELADRRAAAADHANMANGIRQLGKLRARHGSPPSLTIISTVLPGGHGLAIFTACSTPANRFVGPALNAWANGKSVRMLRTTSRSVVSSTTGLGS